MRSQHQYVPPSAAASIRIVVLLACVIAASWVGTRPVPADAAGTGSVTARTYICPDSISLIAVQHAASPDALLAACDPHAFGFSYPQLRGARRHAHLGLHVRPGSHPLERARLR